MLKKNKRLTTKEFQEVFRKGKRVSSPLFTVHILDSDKGKVSVSIPKGLYKKAVDRNYFKRLIFNCLKNQGTLPSLKIVVVLRKKLDNITHKNVYDELCEVIKKINI